MYFQIVDSWLLGIELILFKKWIFLLLSLRFHNHLCTSWLWTMYSQFWQL
jgi:hypothetical protein